MTRQFGELGGGPIGLAVGAQYRGDELTYDYNDDANRDNFLFLIGNPDFGDDRDVDAFFAELALPFTDTLNMQVAARFEDYGDGRFDRSRRSRCCGARVCDFSLRGSVGTSFRAPSLFQAFGTQTTLAELIDPNVGSPQFFPVRTQPNPSGAALRPEEADVLNFGVSFSPTETLRHRHRLLVVRLRRA